MRFDHVEYFTCEPARNAHFLYFLLGFYGDGHFKDVIEGLLIRGQFDCNKYLSISSYLSAEQQLNCQ